MFGSRHRHRRAPSPDARLPAVATAKCSSGLIVSGGYLSTYAGDYVPTYIHNYRSGSTWRVSGYNPSGLTQYVTAQVNCLTGWKVGKVSATVSQNYQHVSAEGIGQAGCNSGVASGGGWSIAWTNLNFPYQCLSFTSTDYTCDMDYRDPADSSSVYAECLVAP